MEDRDEKKLNEQESEEEKKKITKKASLSILVVLAAMVAVIMFFTDFVEQKFGKTTGTIALCVVAALIAAFLYKDEIKKFFKRK